MAAVTKGQGGGMRPKQRSERSAELVWRGVPRKQDSMYQDPTIPGTGLLGNPSRSVWLEWKGLGGGRRDGQGSRSRVLLNPECSLGLILMTL